MKGTNRLRKPGSVKKHLLGRVHSASEVYDYVVRQTQEDINKGLNKRIEEVAQSATEVISKGTTALSAMEYGKMYFDESNGKIFIPLEEGSDGSYNVVEISANGIYRNTSDGTNIARNPVPALIPLVDHPATDTSVTIYPETYHRWGEMASLTIALGNVDTDGNIHEWHFEFVSGSTATVLTLPDTLLYGKSGELEVEANMIYEIHILGSKVEWDAFPTT